MHRLEMLLGLLAAIAFLAAIGRRFKIADPIVFAIGGLVMARVPQIPDIVLPPDLVLLVFLPPLIYAASRNTSWREVRNNARPILFLAVGLVLATMTAVAVVVHLILPTLPWAAAFLLGAIVAPPDAVAATSIAGSLGLPRPLVEVLEGEGLFNDVTALVAFQIALGVIVARQEFNAAAATGTFLMSGVVATFAGLAVGWLGHRALYRLHNATSEVTLTILEPFAAYLLAERFHASGVMAVLALALYQSNLKTQSISTSARLLSGAMWEIGDFLLTGFAFVLMGMQLPRAAEGMASETAPHVALLAFLVSAVVVVIRPLWIFCVGWLTRPLRPRNPDGSWKDGLKKRGLVVVGWAGMRGVISLALALSLPTKLSDGSPFPGRGMMIVVTFAVIFVTLVGQGLTLPLLIRRLNVQSSGRTAAKAELRAQIRLAHAALDHLDEMEGDASAAAVARVRRHFVERLETAQRRSQRGEERLPESETDAEVAQLMREVVSVQHETLQEMRRSGEVDTPTALRLQRRLDTFERLRGV